MLQIVFFFKQKTAYELRISDWISYVCSSDLVWAATALGLFRIVRRDIAIWLVLLGGWLALPPADYAAAGHPEVLPYWIIGSALPSDIWLSKAWTAPAIATMCSLLCDRARPIGRASCRESVCRYV